MTTAIIKRIIIVSFAAFILCGCHKSFKSVDDAPEAHFGVIITSAGDNEEDLKSYAETAISLHEQGKITALVIAAGDDDRNTLYSCLSGTGLEKMVALNVDPGKTGSVLYDIRDVMGFHSSYLVIRNHRLILW